MKPTYCLRNFLLQSSAALALLVSQATAATFTWTGAFTDWSNASSWTGGVPTVANTTDVIIAGTVNVGMFARDLSPTLRSLTFDDSNDANTTFSLYRTSNPGSAPRFLTFSSDSGNATLTVAAGSTGNKNFNGGGGAQNNIILTSSLDIIHNGSGTLNFNTTTIINGAGGINKSGTGTLILNGANTYSGNTLVSAGIIDLGNTLALQNSAYDTASVNGGLDVTGFTTPTLGGLTGSVNLTSTLITGYGSISSLTLSPQTGITKTYSGDVGNGNGSMALTKTGSGTQILSGANTNSGGTTITTGTLSLGSGGTTGKLTATSAITNNSNLTINRSNAFSQATDLGAGIAITGTGSFTQAGAGTTTLTAVNTYTGATNVNSGTLIVNGNISSSLLTTVASGATLGGSGTLGKTVINGTLAIGNSPGTMTFLDTLGLNGSNVMEIDGISGAGVAGGHDFINLTGIGSAGVLTYGGSMTLDMGVVFTVGSYSWNLFDMASETGTFTAISLTDQYSGNLLDADLNGIWDLSSGNDTWQFTESSGALSLTVIPEPNVAALLGGLGALLLLRRRR
jgi:autotransporter-associated beta strand protein